MAHQHHHHHPRDHPEAKLYYPVTCKQRTGALIFAGDAVAFHDDESQGDKAVELDWVEVIKITANVATSPVSLLRLTQVSGNTITFKLESRAVLNQCKSEMKNYWKTAHEESMRNYDDEDFEESKREEDDLFFQPASVAASDRYARAHQNHTIGTIPEAAPPPVDNMEDISNRQNHASPIQLLPKDEALLLPRKKTQGQFHLDFSNYNKAPQGNIEVSALHRNGEPVDGLSRTLDLESFLRNGDVENQEGFYVSQSLCKSATAAIVCGVCVVLFMAIALVILSALLWEERNNNDNDAVRVYADDFYAGYFNNNEDLNN